MKYCMRYQALRLTPERRVSSSVQVKLGSSLNIFRRRWTVNLCCRYCFKTKNEETRFSWTEVVIRMCRQADLSHEFVAFLFQHLQTHCPRQFSGPLIVGGSNRPIGMGIVTAG